MQHHQPDMERDVVKDAKGSVNLIVFTIWAFAIPAQVLLWVPASQGARYFSTLHAMVGFFTPLATTLIWPRLSHPETLLRLMTVMFVMLIVHRIASWRRNTRPDRRHSYQLGFNWAHQWGLSYQASVAMNMLLMLGCALIAPRSEALAACLAVSLFCDMLTCVLLGTRDSIRATNLRDAKWEAEDAGERASRIMGDD